MAKLWIGNKLYSVENEVQDYCDKQDERIELLKSRIEQLEYAEICEDCSAKAILPEPHGIGCKAKERIKGLEKRIDNQDKNIDARIERLFRKIKDKQAERIKELEATNKKLRAMKCPPISDGDTCICPIEELEAKLKE